MTCELSQMWRNIRSVLNRYNVEVIFTIDQTIDVLDGVRLDKNHSGRRSRMLSVGDSPTHYASCIRFGDLRAVVVDADFNNDEAWLAAVHEAAHLLMDDCKTDETCGVAQLELMLAKQISPDLLKALVKMQDEVYVWDGHTYKETKKMPEWRRGVSHAKSVLHLNQRGS